MILKQFEIRRREIELIVQTYIIIKVMNSSSWRGFEKEGKYFFYFYFFLVPESQKIC